MSYTKSFIINEESERLLRQFDGDYLANVFQVWNCDGQNWIQQGPVVFRFDREDILAWLSGKEWQMQLGTVKTAEPRSMHEILPDAPPESCLIWRSNNSFSSLIGRDNLTQLVIDFLCHWSLKVQDDLNGE